MKERCGFRRTILHVYISHLAVGGGLFIWLTDLKGFKENNPEVHDYVYKHTWFFLLLTMVFGGVSGVGIWFIIALVQPAASFALVARSGGAGVIEINPEATPITSSIDLHLKGPAGEILPALISILGEMKSGF